MRSSTVVLYVFGTFNVLIIGVILWKLSTLEVQQSGGNSPVRQVEQILQREKIKKEAAAAAAAITPAADASTSSAAALSAAAAAAAASQPKAPPLKIAPPPVEGKKRRRNSIEYGIPVASAHPPRRTPVVMIRSKLPAEVLARFQESPLFKSSSKGPEELVKLGLKKTIDYPKSALTHTYYEGYFHALEQSSPVFSRNPRSGKDYDKPAAGDFIRAFYEAFRRANNHTFETLRRRLYNSAVSRRPKHPFNDTCGHVSRWLEQGMHMADLSVQIHWGSHVGRDELFWHSDAENSLLHFCVTVRGSRLLHSMRALTPEGRVREVLEEQAAGDIYLSSSTLMNHAPEYPATAGYGERIAAIQARFLYLTEELKALRAAGVGDGPGWASLVDIFAETLSAATVVVPTIPQIDAVLDERKHKQH